MKQEEEEEDDFGSDVRSWKRHAEKREEERGGERRSGTREFKRGRCPYNTSLLLQNSALEEIQTQAEHSQYADTHTHTHTLADMHSHIHKQKLMNGSG